MLLRDVLSVLDTIAPLRHAEPWDNVGLITGDPGAAVTRALLAIDYTPAVADEAVRERCQLVVAYHPPLFEAIKRVRHDSLIYRAIRDDVAIYSPHTALDVAPGGTNDMLADALRIVERAPLKLAPPVNVRGSGSGQAGPPPQTPPRDRSAPAEPVGIGRVGTLAFPTPRGALLAHVKEELGLQGLLVAGPLEGDVTRVAVCAGAGRGLLEDAIAAGAELYLTGELPHHDALRAARAGMTVACALHSNSERAALRKLAARIEAAAPGVQAIVSAEDRDPFVFR